MSEETRVPHQTPVSSPALNEAQRLHFRVSCEYMDKMLREIEGILHSGEGASPFSRYRLDLSPAQGRVLEDYIRRFRSQLLRVLAWQKIVPPPPGVPATRSIVTHLHFIDIAISELRPNQMRGSGTLSEETAAELTGVLRELSSIAENMMRYVRDDLSESLQQRAEKLIAEGKGPALLRRIEAVVTARGLVEFRPRLDMLLVRLEDATFEVALFGRVSSGKSSFLDALLGTDLLPVGANPITAVPTRVQYGERVAARVRFGNGAATEVPVERFRELISETGNPGNREGVRYAQLMIPSPRLSEGIVLVDTPGLGSLALRGAEETLAYLPSCDLAVVLIDAGSSLTLEDIGTLRLVLEAGIPAIVLLSKADLLRDEERAASVEYIRAQIERELRKTVPVHAVSSVDRFRWMVDEFYREDLEARFRQSHELRQQSVHAKLSRLQQDVVAALEVRLHHAEAPAIDAASVPSMEKMLTDAAGEIGVLDRTLEDKVLALGFRAPALMIRVAQESVTALDGTGAAAIAFDDLAARVQRAVQAEVEEMIGLFHRVVRSATQQVSRVGRELKSSGIPDENEIAGVIRDAPRFELPEMTGSVALGFSRHLGTGAMQKRVLKTAREKLQPTLNRELSAYSSFLAAWVRGVLRNIQFAVNSFADVYRASMQEMVDSKEPGEQRAELERDIAALQE